MKTETRHMIEWIIQGIILSLLFLPGTYKEWDNWYDTEATVYGGIMGAKATKLVSFVTKNFNVQTVCCILILAIVIACLAILIILFIMKEKKGSTLEKFGFILPITELILFIIQSFFLTEEHSLALEYNLHWSTYKISFLYFIILAFIIALVLISTIGYYKTTHQDDTQTDNTNNSDSAKSIKNQTNNFILPITHTRDFEETNIEDRKQEAIKFAVEEFNLNQKLIKTYSGFRNVTNCDRKDTTCKELLENFQVTITGVIGGYLDEYNEIHKRKNFTITYAISKDYTTITTKAIDVD